MAMGLGTHLLLDALSDKSLPRDAVQRFLMAMPGAIGMTPIVDDKGQLELHIYRTSDGWAGVQLIAESHIAIHTKGKEVNLDIFSCKSFEEQAAIDLAVKMLGLVQVRTQILTRGWEIPVEEEAGK